MIVRLLLVLATLGSTGWAAQRRVPTTELGVDVLTLTDGDRVLGSVTGEARDGTVTIAVRRAWLKENLPERHDELLEAAERERRAAHDRRIARITAWRNERLDHAGISRFLETQTRKLEAAFATDDEGDGEADDDIEPTMESEFVLLSFAKDELRRTYVQPPSRRVIAALAWRERLRNVESRSVDSLGRELRRGNVAMPGQPVDLSDRLPRVSAADEDGDAWAARVAVVEYQYVESLDYQGTGDVLVRTTGRDEQPGLEEVLAEFAKPVQGLNILDLVDPPRGGPKPGTTRKAPSYEKAIAEAEKRGLKGFRVTTVEPNLLGKRTVVETRFVAKLPAGWRTIWRNTSTADASKARPELEERIAEDERVGQLLKTVGALGLGGDGAMTTAVRFGAATMAAQEEANDAFYEFTESVGGSLDAPIPPVRADSRAE